MGVSMAATAVGLFANATVAESVAEALRANAIPSRGIRILAKPINPSAENAMGSPALAFVAALSRDLRTIGATDREIDAYLAGLEQGDVLVLASGTLAHADAACAVMNAFDPIEVEEFSGTAAATPPSHASEAVSHGLHSQGENAHARTEGARLFYW